MSLPWFLIALLLSLFAPQPAEKIASDAGATCERGCIVGADGWVYEVSRDDLVWTARMANCEIGSVIGTDEARATMWTVVQNFYRRHLLGRTESLGSFVQSYSACTSKRWSSAGTRYSSRITPLADANRKLRWHQIPQRVRDFVKSFFRAEIPNRWPGYVIVWTAGWEDHAERRLIGPYYVEDRGPGSFNAYYKSPETRDWNAWTVRIVPPPTP